MDKNELRDCMKNLRDSIKLEEKKNKDSNILNKVINNKYYVNANTIMAYVSFGSEVDSISIIKQALDNNKVVCVPKIINKKDGMKAIKIEKLEDLIKNKFGILEPIDFKNEIDAKLIDLFLVPGLAFDNNGGRIGYGAGYYDRYLKNSKKNSSKIGLAYDFQIIEKVPMTENDVYMDIIIS